MKKNELAEMVVRAVLAATVYMLLKEAYTTLTAKVRHIKGRESGIDRSGFTEKTE